MCTNNTAISVRATRCGWRTLVPTKACDLCVGPGNNQVVPQRETNNISWLGRHEVQTKTADSSVRIITENRSRRLCVPHRHCDPCRSSWELRAPPVAHKRFPLRPARARSSPGAHMGRPEGSLVHRARGGPSSGESGGVFHRERDVAFTARPYRRTTWPRRASCGGPARWP